LTADNQGFGFSLQDSPFATEGLSEPPIIGNIESRGPAEKCGVLQEADRILAINGQYLENKTLDEATQMLIDAGMKVTLHIEFDVADSVVTTCGIFMVKLAKRGGGLGITVREPKNRKPGDPMIICDVKKGSVAHRTGTIQTFDKLLSVDSLRMHQCSLEEAIEALDNAGEIIRLRIQRDDHAEYKDEEPDPDTVTYTVELDKQGGPLGVTISGTEEPFDPIIISGLSDGGLAQKTGALHFGDRILAINGESLTGLPLSEAINLLQISGDVVTLRIARSLETRKKPNGDSDKNGEGADGEEFTENYEGTPIQSVDSALESWDSSGLENNLPHVPGKPPLPPKARANNRGSPNGNGAKSDGPLLSAKTLSQHNALHAVTDRWHHLDDLNTPSDLTPASSADQDFWSKNLDNLDLLSQSDVTAEGEGGSESAREGEGGSESASLSSLSHIERQTISDGDNAQEGEYILHENSPSETFSTSTKMAAEAHLREVEEEMTHIFTPTAVELNRVILFKLHESDDFGFGLSDGVYEKGVYISAIRPGGPADRSEVIRPFDRILQVRNFFYLINIYRSKTLPQSVFIVTEK
jgi:C-terminal processing protease CtpA/Prc